MELNVQLTFFGLSKFGPIQIKVGCMLPMMQNELKIMVFEKTGSDLHLTVKTAESLHSRSGPTETGKLQQ